jgi:mono/diheme cytochrome c family protein/glucose/arabinose dehydrogenase
MMNYGHFETELHVRFPDSLLFIRNMCDPGDTPGFRPHSSRPSPWAFPGAEKFQHELAQPSGSQGHFETPDQWLTRLEADIILGFFGYNESFEGSKGVESFKDELEAFIKHTQSQNYNGGSATHLVLISPIAFEDLSQTMDLPDGIQENRNLKLYTEAMREVASEFDIPFVNVMKVSEEWYDESDDPLTIDGSQLNDTGYRKLAEYLADALFGGKSQGSEEWRENIHMAVQEKNWMWHQDIKIPNGVHAYGRRYNPFGPQNYPAEIKKIREMTSNRDQAIWKVAKGEKYDLTAADAATTKLPEVQTNYDPENKNGQPEYLYGQDALDKFQMAPGYEISLFASEKEFSDLANPVQLSFDNQGRLWVATMPTYPHYRPGDAKPNDKLIILEDTDGDGKADKQTTFADGLHLPLGFEIAPEGVYLSQGTNMILLLDTDGDGISDKREILLSGFDDHDTHHAHSTYTTDPSGAIYMGEGVFLHTNVETSYGPVRATNGGFYRYAPQRKKLERVAQLEIPNPWGIAFDDWGQPFFAETSGPDVLWMMPGTVKSRYGIATPKSRNLIEQAHLVRPTSGMEFISSRHFPEEVQGDLLINNTIGFLGTKQHAISDDGTGYQTKHRQDLLRSDDPNFRPVDMEFAPDGSLYLADWHNVLIGHMQHNARDPLRDHVHGRIYRITYPSRPLISPVKVADATIDELLNNLLLPEYRVRSRSRRELRGRDTGEVIRELNKWADQLDREDPNYEHYLLEGLWVSWGMNQIDENLLKTLLQANDFRVRAAAVQVLRYAGHQVDDQLKLLIKAASDVHGRVRLEAIVAASWLTKEEGLAILNEASTHPLDDWMTDAYETSLAHLNGISLEQKRKEELDTKLAGDDLIRFTKGKEIYERDGFCSTCHQADGNGLPSSGFPPIAGTSWATGSEERLIKLTIKGLYGPIVVDGKEYPGQVPMTPFGGMLDDEEIAAVLTYVRNSFGNNASPITPAKVKEVRESIKNKKGFYSPEELLKEHPMENNEN